MEVPRRAAGVPLIGGGSNAPCPEVPEPPTRARVGDEDGEEGDLLLAAKKRQRPSPSPEARGPGGGVGQGGGGGGSGEGAGGSGFWKTPG